ncbi:TetR/AcrR family transcriptional regulator [Alteromonas sp. ASW11-19]|uniref:TetR/AcrR family transcriptional regulator n=1 Tax=Alteromonas salexigens TaxID=2982530 RepID=A0ABT2VKM9_9ALTE|nr:TetR/AcrR family transcriptional regulator [Alteromonas salexigens]MCU7553337.1 TetR/AcrR family transcriptional regulator [Alteromonas salexigens]
MSKVITPRVGRPKSEQKRQQILTAASELFLQEGFSGTSMDKVARHSGVSKQTVYSHFDSKDALYVAAIEAKCRTYELDPSRLADSNTCELPLSECLQQVGVQFMRLFHDPQVIAMYRVVITEATNNPHVAELFYEAGPKASIDVLARVFEKASDQTLPPAEARQLAIDYFGLLKGEFHIRSLFALASPMSETGITQHVRQAVRKTLRLYEAALPSAT